MHRAVAAEAETHAARQISFSFSGGFCPVNLPLFHGTRDGPVPVDVLMTISFQLKGDSV